MNPDITSTKEVEEEKNASNEQDQKRTAKKSTSALQSQSSGSRSTRRRAAKKASKAISAAASSSSTSTRSSSIEKKMENLDVGQRRKKNIHNAAPTSKLPRALYDEMGRHIASGMDLCDCLGERCKGCFFECVKCGSQKCGTACRANRNFLIESLEYHNQDKIVINPLLKY